MQNTRYETVIGLETHIQLSTKSKIFCADDAQFGAAPNTQVSVISLAHPGTLPRINKKALESAIKLGLALGCNISHYTAFDRKNYFYADLPKGFQTTQDKHPICIGGGVHISPLSANVTQFEPRKIRLHHIHLEEDAGKSIHDQDPTDSLIDLNRAGVPLVEIVSEPDLRGPDEVAAYMENLRKLVRWLDISDGNMEEGSLRCDVNISVRKIGATTYGNRCEIKNMNSMRFAKKAIEFEVARQIEVIENGGTVKQQTRGFDPSSGKTFALRDKENAHDYRYFPEPDLPPIILSSEEIANIQKSMPTLPEALQKILQTRYELSDYDVKQITQDRETADYFLKVADKIQLKLSKPFAKLVINQILPYCETNNLKINDFPINETHIDAYLQMIEDGKIAASLAHQKLFPVLITEKNKTPLEIADQMNLLQSNDFDFVQSIVEQVIKNNPDKVKEYQKGKKGLIGFFMGEVMKLSKGKADPKETTRLLTEHLGKTN
jgi:aspartyl-tRNA(Asn)/glutamyl-tRNA(Gln) amidotransferase subunit B